MVVVAAVGAGVVVGVIAAVVAVVIVFLEYNWPNFVPCREQLYPDAEPDCHVQNVI